MLGRYQQLFNRRFQILRQATADVIYLNRLNFKTIFVV